MYRVLFLLSVTFALAGCRSYVKSTPRHFSEGDHPANYKKIFREPIPSDVTVVNSVVVTYSFRPGVVTTPDYEFEVIAPQSWIEKQTKHFYLRKGEGEFMARELGRRRDHARPWYAPKSLDQYDLYRDMSSVGYVHMLVQKEAESDGRLRLFVSKH
jgi:hypothetical protein